jgi:predicted Zn finger-like uncharacterized protein
MRTSCPHCKTVFRVDPARIPAEGARARCSVCEGIFRVVAPTPSAHTAPVAAFALASAPAPLQAPPAAPTAARPAAPAPATAAVPTAPPRFGSADPEARARRLARALVSDMVMYHPERRERALAQGTLKQEFAEEIRKSWEEYVAQIGQKAAYGTPHFRAALNEILARGGTIF